MEPYRLRAPYPFHPIEGVEAYASAQATWDRLLADMRSARERLWVENYIIEDGVAGEAVFEAMREAADNGADVRLLADALGSIKLSTATAGRLRDQGIKVKWFNPFRFSRFLRIHRLQRLLRRTHRRAIVIDDKVGWVGGMAFADAWWPHDGDCETRETMLRFEGPAVRDLAECFRRLWRWPPRYRRPGLIEAAEEDQLRLVPQYARGGSWFRRALRHRLRHADRRAWLATPYFIPTMGLRRHLRRAAKRGIDVRLLLPGRKHDHRAVWFAGRRYYGRLLKAGVRIWEYQPRFLHAKTALFDEEWSLVGSPNLDRWSSFVIHELAAETRSAALTQQLDKQFQEDLAHSREITREQWKARPWHNRFFEHFFGIFDSAF